MSHYLMGAISRILVYSIYPDIEKTTVYGRG